MNLVICIRQMVEAGLTHEQALIAAEVVERNMQPVRSKGAIRQERYRRRNEASQSVTSDVRDDSDASDVSPPKEKVPPNPPKRNNPLSSANAPVFTLAREGSRVELLAEAKAAQQSFERFWLEYPRKVAKPEGQKAYFRALKRITGPDPPGVILAGLRAHLDEWREIEPHLIPHPSTWLNQDRFNDRATRRTPANDQRRTSQSFRSQDADAHDSNLVRAFAASATAAGLQGRDVRDPDDFALASPGG